MDLVNLDCIKYEFFHQEFLQQMRPNPFPGEILNGKGQFSSSDFSGFSLV